jgi:hypothetical protein
MDSHFALGIRFNDCLFHEPTRLQDWTPPKCAGLFGILINDSNWAPKPFQLLCFGEFGNNASLPGLLKDCDRVMAAANGKPLFVAVFPMPFSTTAQRLTLRNDLIWAYNPVCQGEGHATVPNAFASRLNELEIKHQEHTAQFMTLMNGLNNNPEQPGPRRRIGFMPHTEPAS